MELLSAELLGAVLFLFCVNLDTDRHVVCLVGNVILLKVMVVNIM